ncbi:MAG: AAA family ATPase [Chloroflexi bacterium]|nr:AAA family ATPase [Chloroflexota bacterium]
MFTSISIRNFRGFRDFTIDRLDRVNLIAGPNDVGKTSLLEAVFLLVGETNLSLLVKLHAFRGLEKMEGDVDSISDWLWMPLFYRLDSRENIEIEGCLENATRHRSRFKLMPRTSAQLSLREHAAPAAGAARNGLSSKMLMVEHMNAAGEQLTSQMVIDEKGMRVEPLPPPLSIPGFFLSGRGRAPLEEDARNLGELLVEKEPYQFLEVLQIIEPRLTRVNTIPGAGGTIIYGDIGLGRMLPLALLGDGLGRLASLVIKIASARGGIVLVDEIENGLHYSLMPRVWMAIGQAARQFDVQVFATTHSWECIRAAHEAFSSSEMYDFRLHRLDRVNGDIVAANYDRDSLATSIEMGLEVR